MCKTRVPDKRLIEDFTVVLIRSARERPGGLPARWDLKSQLGPYMAGLIEGDGSIIVPKKDKSLKGKKYHPIIRIVFHKNDLPLAQHLQSLLQGQLRCPQDKGYVLWEIQDLTGFTRMTRLVNGYFRSPKIEALHRLIHWLNTRGTVGSVEETTTPQTTTPIEPEFKQSIPLLGLDRTPIYSNSWLAGFSDADGNFATSIYSRAGNQRTRVQQFFRLEIRQTYHKNIEDQLGGSSYFKLLSEITCYLGVNLLSRTRLIDDKVYHSFTIIDRDLESHVLVKKYFDTYPLYSSKRLNYEDWCKIEDLIRSKVHLTPEGLQLCRNLKNSMNDQRTYFNWNHLSEFYTP